MTHYFGHVQAAAMSIESGELRVGDTIHVRGHTTDFYQRVERIEVDHRSQERAGPGDNAAVGVTQRVRPHDVVYRLAP